MPSNSLLRFITCGSVDDGKSTLIGRLLYDTRAILADALAALEASSRRRGLSEIDLSLLTDGLQAEREQGITIDVAYRYFSTGNRSYILADAPGHAQYTRNMITGASTADVAILLIDARKGVVEQTRRHLVLAHLMGLPHVLVAVNKMDLVGYQQTVFDRIVSEVQPLADKLGVRGLRVLPISALKGEQVVASGEAMQWYEGPTLLELLESLEVKRDESEGPFRFPVQRVCRPRSPELLDYRGYQGRIESGRVRVGDPVVVQPSGARSWIRRIERFEGELQEAEAGQSVTLHLGTDVDLSRGDLLAGTERVPEVVHELTATLCWLGDRSLEPSTRLVFRHGPREVRARVHHILGRLDLDSLESQPATTLTTNDIATVRLRLQAPVAMDPHVQVKGNGVFILVDETSHATVGAGMVLATPNV